MGVAPPELSEDDDFEERMQDIHIELQTLNEEAGILANKIIASFKHLGL